MIHHAEQGKDAIGLSSAYTMDCPLVFRAGALGVTLFFVLSGFLITYLLLTELQTTSTVRIRNFYMRRILRIWPLYYFIVLLAWVLVPRLRIFDFPMFRSPFGPEYLSRISFFLLLCPQLALPRLVTPTLAGPLWSVGVEEQFYAFWPWLVRAFKGRILLPCLAVIALCVLAGLEVKYAQRRWKDPAVADTLTYLRNVIYWSRFSCMAIGGIGAWLCINYRDRIQFFFRRDVQALLLAVLGIGLVKGIAPRGFDHEAYSVVFALLIMNIALNPRSLLRLENRVCSFMGEISYGLYVYHWFVVVLVMNALQGMGGIENGFLRNVFVYAGVFGGTIAVATLSYRFLERPFLKMKDSFAVILSGSAAKPRPDVVPPNPIR
jgi:peptidoglycan/LPS O-acetylase OafA/YrhL